MQLTISEKVKLQSTYGDWAVITGASSGIGLELAIQLAASGFYLVLNARNLSTLETVRQRLLSQSQVEILLVAADLSEAPGVDSLITACRPLNIGLFIASAGFGTSGNFIHNSMYAEINMVQLNCVALLSLTHYFANRFVAQGRGGIILMSSIVAFQGTPSATNYAATKAYVQTLAEGLAEELRPHGVAVLAAAPGPVNSGFGQRANMKMDFTLRPDQVGVPILRALGKRTIVYPGGLTKLLMLSLRTLPRWAKVKVMGKVMGGMTAHQDK